MASDRVSRVNMASLAASLGSERRSSSSIRDSARSSSAARAMPASSGYSSVSSENLLSDVRRFYRFGSQKFVWPPSRTQLLGRPRPMGWMGHRGGRSRDGPGSHREGRLRGPQDLRLRPEGGP